jgi:hypothetical protein
MVEGGHEVGARGELLHAGKLGLVDVARSRGRACRERESQEDFGFWILDFHGASPQSHIKSKIQNPRSKMTRSLVVFVSLLFTVPLFAAIAGSDAAEMLIPIAGQAAGAGGESFVTDLTLVNFVNTPQNVELTWLPLGGAGTPQKVTVVIDGHKVRNLLNVVNGSFGATGVGAIHIRGGASMDAHARIYTETTCAGLAGTVNQSVPAVLLDGWRNGSPAYVHGARSNAHIRTNYGIVNLDAQPRVFRVIVNSVGGKVEEVVTVPGNGTVHHPVPQPVEGDLSIYFEPFTGEGAWHGYAASVDNRTGDGWTMIAIQPRTDVVYGEESD